MGNNNNENSYKLVKLTPHKLLCQSQTVKLSVRGNVSLYINNVQMDKLTRLNNAFIKDFVGIIITVMNLYVANCRILTLPPWV